MQSPISPKLLPLIVAPDDKSKLSVEQSNLKSRNTGKTYAIKSGIPACELVANESEGVEC